MAEKRDRCKFTIQFNPADPSHAQVIELLNQNGRRKAQFIVNAVQHYLHCSETPDVSQNAPIDAAMVEAVVRRILNEKNIALSDMNQANKAQARSEPIVFDDLSSENLSAIVGTMALFQQETE